MIATTAAWLTDAADRPPNGQSSTRPTRVLVVHNRYQQAGGEDFVCEAEAALLQRFGHEVEIYERHNDELKDYSAWRSARDTIWSPATMDALQQIAQRFQPQVVHIHNTFPLISPSVYWAAARAGAAVVQTLHNFRLLCPQGIFLRSGRSCEECLGQLPWRAVGYACYRGSRRASMVAATMLTLHRAAGTYRTRVDRYIALSQFARSKFVAGGLPADKVVVKPNFVDEVPSAAPGLRSGGLFVGRLSAQKGIRVLIEALRQGKVRGRLRIVGGGDLEQEVRAEFGKHWLGMLPTAEVLRTMRSAEFLVVPSLGYEGFPRSIAEAYACGLPVIASRCGSLSEIVMEGKTGLLFEPGDPVDLARAINWALENASQMRQMGVWAREQYERRYSPEQNYRELAAIYQQALCLASQRGNNLGRHATSAELEA